MEKLSSVGLISVLRFAVDSNVFKTLDLKTDPSFFSPPPFCVLLVNANVQYEGDNIYSIPIAFSHLFCYTQETGGGVLRFT